MFFTLNLLFYYSILPKTDEIQYYSKKIRIFEESQSFSNQRSWYFVQIPSEILFSERFIQLNIQYNSNDIISSDWCRLFLTTEQARSIKLEFNCTIQPFSDDDKAIDLDYSQTQFFAEFHNSFQPINTTKTKFILLFHTIYEIFTTEIYQVLKIPELIYINNAPNNQLHNRWSIGMIQHYGSPRMTRKGFQNARYLHEHNISGQGQVITIVDTGLDVNHSFFYDSEHHFIYDKLNPNHRKVLFYNSYGNEKDASKEGHGTHVAGTAAGKSMCGNEMSLFDGSSPDAKINFIDISQNDDASKLLSMPITLLSTAMGLTKSFVTSNSWGSSRNYGQTVLYDMAAQFLRDRLFVFSAGNTGDSGYMTVNSPSDSKNVLSVGALGETYGQLFDAGNNYIMKMIVQSSNGENTIDITQLSGDSPYWTTKGIYQIETSTSPQKNKVYITKHAESICSTSDPYAAIILSSNKPSCKPSYPVFNNIGSEDILLNSKTVTISLTLSQQFFNPAINLYSSKGPSYYGITKPDVVAPGENIKSASSKTSENVHSCNVNDLITKTGTSMAAPNVAGLAVLIYQYFLEGNYVFNDKLTKEESSFEPGSSLVRAIIISSTNKLANTWEPSPVFGHGIPSIDKVLTFDKNLKVFKDIEITQNEDISINFTLRGSSSSIYGNGRDLRIAMAYLDNSGYSDSSPLTVDLDMYLVRPNGEVIYGNQKSNNREEHLSTCEKIVIENAQIQIGTYQLHIIGNGNIRYAFRQKQLFSLVISGPLDDSTLFNLDTSKIEWSRSKYVDNCQFPYLGLHCQIKGVEVNTSANLPLIPIAESFFYFSPSRNWSNMTIVFTKPDFTEGKTVIQLSTAEQLYYRSYQYERTYSTLNTEYHVFVKRQDLRFKESKMISLRIVNLSPNELNYSMEAFFDEYVPPVPDITKPVPTWKTIYSAGITIGYALFATTFSLLIVVVLLYAHRVRGYRKVVNSQDQSMTV